MKQKRMCILVGGGCLSVLFACATASATQLALIAADINAGHGQHSKTFTEVELAAPGSLVTIQVVVQADLAGPTHFLDFGLGPATASSNPVATWFVSDGVTNCFFPFEANIDGTTITAEEWNDLVISGTPRTVYLLAVYSAAVQQYCLACTNCDCSGDFRCDLPQTIITISYTGVECIADSDCDDGVGCTDDTCVNNACVFSANDSLCPDDGLFCNGIETCDVTNDCSSSGDPCGGTLPPVCDETSGRCVDCLLPAVFPGTTYACDDTLPRIMRNVLRFQFACPVTLPVAGEVEIRELMPNGLLGPDLSDRFDFALEGTPGFETILRIEEDGCRGGTCNFGVSPAVCVGGLDDTQPCGQVFVNETWYAVRNSGAWAGVANFKVDYASVYGDADNFGGTGFNDLPDYLLDSGL